jgi:hypothetical protein
MGMERNTIELGKVNPPPFSRSRLNGHASAGEISTGRTEAASLFYILYKPRCCFDDYRVAHTEERRERRERESESCHGENDGGTNRISPLDPYKVGFHPHSP